MAENYMPNSHKSKEGKAALPEKKVEKVVTGKAKVKKKNEIQKLASAVVKEDIGSIKSYIFMDVLIPAITNTIHDIITDSADMIFGGRRGGSKRSNTAYVPYDRFSSNKRDDRRTETRVRFDYDDIIFTSRGEVEAVREQMEDIIESYGFVTVADLYDMADLSAPYTSNKYGWTNIRNAEPVRVRDGYVIKLPKAMPID